MVTRGFEGGTRTVLDLHLYCANPFADERERDITLWIRDVEQ